jgi:hypothetical protein
MAGLPASCGRCPFASGRGAKTCRSPCGPGEFEGRRNDACHKCPAGKYNPCRQGYGMVLSLAEDGVAAVNAAQEFKVGRQRLWRVVVCLMMYLIVLLAPTRTRNQHPARVTERERERERLIPIRIRAHTLQLASH